MTARAPVGAKNQMHVHILPHPAGIVSPLGPGVKIHPVYDRVDAAVEDGGQVDDVLHQARHKLRRLVIHVFPDVIKNRLPITGETHDLSLIHI